ncbi:MAG: hypothetical protein MJ070_10240 [Lachnospiraceae bacterium]|nr:hypothetical protein [Lachnospiraceae bacterium]
MKKLLALLLALCTLLSCMMLAVYADEEPAEGEEPADPFSHETYTFEVFKESEEEFLVAPSPNKNDALRFSDGTTETIYCYTIKNIYSFSSILWKAKTSQQLLLQVAQVYKEADTEWVDVYRYEWDDSQGDSQGIPAEMREYEMKDFFDASKGNKLYIRIADQNPDNGWGGCIYTGVETVLDVAYTPLTAEELDAYETAAAEDSISLHGMNAKFGSFEVDNENQVAGSGCLTINVGKGFVNECKFETPVDATGFDTFEFDWYISDLAILDKFQQGGMDSGFEITSAGKCDEEETSWHIAELRDNNKGAELKTGWNHVVLYLDEAAQTGVNLANVNYIRIFMVNETEDTGVTLKYDNLRLTKAYAAAVEAAKAEAAPFIEMAQKLIDDAKNGINADNFDAVKKAYNSYDRKTKDLDALVKEQLGSDITKGVREVKKALEDYEESLKETAAPETAAPETQNTGDTEGTDEPTEKSNTGLIIGIVAAAVVIIAAVLFFILKGKKK